MNYKNEREQLVKYGKLMSKEGLSPGTSGNLSIFIEKDKVILISPSGISYDKIETSDIVLMDLDGNLIGENRKPSSEWQLHIQIYKNKPKAKSIVHTHSIFATTISTLRMPILPVHYVIADANASKIACANYKRYGTKELADEAVSALGDSKAVLLANHGLVVYEKSLEDAFSLAKEVEYLAEIQYRAMSIGKPVLLTRKEIEEVSDGFKTYGQK